MIGAPMLSAVAVPHSLIAVPNGPDLAMPGRPGAETLENAR